jgi:hypothetical protein
MFAAAGSAEAAARLICALNLKHPIASCLDRVFTAGGAPETQRRGYRRLTLPSVTTEGMTLGAPLRAQ